MKESESGVQKACLSYLWHKGIFHYRNNTGALKTEHSFIRFGAVGSPDIVVVMNGVYIAIECKGPKGKQSEDQKRFQTELEAAGGKYYIVRSLDDLMAVI